MALEIQHKKLLSPMGEAAAGPSQTVWPLLINSECGRLRSLWEKCRNGKKILN